MKRGPKYRQLVIDFTRPADRGLRADPVTRFWRYVDRRSDGCWLWTSSVQSAGYGTIYIPGRGQVLAHRFSLEIHIGGAPGDRPIAMHSCDTPCCVNPAHLRWGTTLENQQDKAQKGRARNRYTVRREA